MIRYIAASLLMALSASAVAQVKSAVSTPSVSGRPVAQRSVNEWLQRMHDASRQRAYVGTFVVAGGGRLSSARIWHVCDGTQQMERVESLTGAPRSTFRRNDQVLTFLPESRVVLAEKRESLGLFPQLLQSTSAAIGQYYGARELGSERVAGFEADVLELRPTDRLRFGYRAWIEKNTGLTVKLQTLDSQGQVLEQAAFSELKFEAPVGMAQLEQMMGRTEGYRLEKPEMRKTTAEAQGWALKQSVPGFQPMSCYQRSVNGSPQSQEAQTLQWIFSDGLASVSLFIEPFVAERHGQPKNLAMGATHTLTRRLGAWWLTAVGEVPTETLVAFAQALERQK
ncbi:MucB/RseB C-terminal domain-containing protein [Rhodoferax sp.]|uniref:MucB/RseB C-terminal domain-containing protein n=1 Tax=Rhodoferax sp. TaxID=50421 RepID=UPI0025E62C31|nr:MucB/RseB C-terminal domain-containing protein [Rhodoferax sp.]